MKKNVFFLGTLCLVTLSLIFSGCKKENNDPQEPAQVQTYQMSIQASKGTDNQANGPRRVLGLDGTTLNATWQAGEQVSVYNATKGADLTGSLEAQSSGASTQLTGELTGTIEVGDKLTLKYLSPSYATQDGTIGYISEHCDYAVAENVEVTSISGETIYTVGEATFENRQAVVKFTLLDKADDAALSSTTQLIVKVGEDTYTVTPASATSEMFVALPGFAGETVTLTATVGSDTYTYEKTGATFANGKFYQITAKLTKQVPEGAINGKFSVSSTKQVYFAKGNLQFTRTSTSVAWSTGKFSFMDNQYDYIETSTVSGNYANETAIGLFGWATSNINTPKTNTNYLPTNTNNTSASYGSGITSGNVNWSDNDNAFANYDWGENTADLGTGWRTLTTAEWQYLFNTRTNASNLRTWATVNGVKGMILMPDGWTAGGVSLTVGTGFGTNDINTTDWATLEGQGCVFLPAAGYRYIASLSDVRSRGYYWSSTSYTSYSDKVAYYMSFNGSVVGPADANYRHFGLSVRLVKNAN